MTFTVGAHSESVSTAHEPQQPLPDALVPCTKSVPHSSQRDWECRIRPCTAPPPSHGSIWGWGAESSLGPEVSLIISLPPHSPLESLCPNLSGLVPGSESPISGLCTNHSSATVTLPSDRCCRSPDSLDSRASSLHARVSMSKWLWAVSTAGLPGLNGMA